MTRFFFILVVAIAVVILLRAFRSPAPSAKGRPETLRSRMSRAEALEVLGLNEGASREEMQAAYKSLIKKVHPDAPGGSGYLATKLNQAKQTLLD